MSRSPAVPANGSSRIKATELLTAVAYAYDAALQAAASDDMQTCTSLLDATETLLADSGNAVVDAATPSAQQEALSAHARLTSVLKAQLGEVGDELGRMHQGKKALAIYGGERLLGEHVRSRA